MVTNASLKEADTALTRLLDMFQCYSSSDFSELGKEQKDKIRTAVSSYCYQAFLSGTETASVHFKASAEQMKQLFASFKGEWKMKKGKSVVVADDTHKKLFVQLARMTMEAVQKKTESIQFITEPTTIE